MNFISIIDPSSPCVNHSCAPVIESGHDQNGILKGQCGSLPCPSYSQHQKSLVMCAKTVLLINCDMTANVILEWYILFTVGLLL